MEQALATLKLLWAQNTIVYNFNLGIYIKMFHFEVMANSIYLDTPFFDNSVW